MNYIKTAGLLGLLTGLLLVIGQLIGGTGGLVIAFAFALIMNIATFFFSDKIVLTMYRAKQVSEKDYPQLYGIVKELSQNAKMPMPKVYVMNSATPNAFATGRSPKHAAVAATTGILDILSEKELRGVMAHELAHVKNRDVLIATIAAIIAGAISMLANMAQFAAFFGGMNRDGEGGGNLLTTLLLAFLAPVIAMIIQFAISRSREYHADALGAKISKDPHALADALAKLEQGNHQRPMDERKDNPVGASLFIVNPFTARKVMHLFSTHPPTKERIKRLRAM